MIPRQKSVDVPRIDLIPGRFASRSDAVRCLKYADFRALTKAYFFRVYQGELQFCRLEYVKLDRGDERTSPVSVKFLGSAELREADIRRPAERLPWE